MKERIDSLSRLLSPWGNVLECRPVGGGCISEAMCVTVANQEPPRQCFFAKCNRIEFIDNFRCELEGLRRLAEVEAIRVPQPLLCEVDSGSAWLVTEWIDQGSASGGRAGSSGFFERFGRQLASLHKESRGRPIGLDHDNFLGSAKQVNTPDDSWVDFFANQRLGFQLQWAGQQGLANQALRRRVEQIIDKMPELLQGRDEETSLLHGDLWSGNYLRDANGQPVIIDPAIYCGCREAEFGMLQLFGGCPSRFYEAYEETWPLPAGWQRRVKIYVLYHLLNHLNLFGSGYAAQCDALAGEILRRT